MGFDRYRCVLDRIFSFSKLPDVPLSFPIKKMKVKIVESFADRFRLFSSLVAGGCPCDVARPLLIIQAGLEFIRRFVVAAVEPNPY